jgi:FAD/FMN-containing dehydrogenase
MATITNYDGSITTTPQKVVQPKTVEEIQAILTQPDNFPSPVRAMGSFHSLTPCASSTGTVVDMTAMKKIVKIDAEALTFTAQAGLEMIEANRALRKQGLQFMLNIEIGNLTVGSAACCHTKDSLDAVEFGQVNSYITGVKWVTPSGQLAEASLTTNPELLPLIRASYGLAGIVYEVTFRIKPVEIVKFDYHVHESKDLTDDMVSSVIASNQCMVAWTVERTTVLQTRNQATELRHDWLAQSRQFGWNFLGAFGGRVVRRLTPEGSTNTAAEDFGTGIEIGFYRLISALGGFTLEDPDKMIDYSKTPQIGRYAFTFWAFPRANWVANLKAYLDFRDEHFRVHGFRPNMPLGSYFVRRDTSSLLSYTHDGDVISLDPIHAPGERDHDDWDAFLNAFNEWAHARGGIPLLNQSPFVKKAHVVSAYGDRWTALCKWVREQDPNGRMINAFFQELMVG